MTHLSGLPGLLHATRRALAVVGIDSGPMHLAAALDKPGVAVFGPTDPGRNGPYGKSFAVLRGPARRNQLQAPAGDLRLHEGITPEAVFRTLKDRISARNLPPDARHWFPKPTPTSSPA